jgi:aminotransferase
VSAHAPENLGKGGALHGIGDPQMSRLCAREGGVNLAQGFPDFPAPLPMKEAAKRAIDADKNQYAVTWGAPALREAIARRSEAQSGLALDPEREITVCCGATEAMIAALMATLDPLDEVVIFTPFYENYGPDCLLGREPAGSALRAPDWS